jgi:ABC-type glycerol-3-phosphate transport system permease component
MSMFYNEEISEYKVLPITIAISLAVILLIAFSMWLFPVYGVWAAQMNGKAQLSEAEFSKQVKYEEAKANLESQKLNAQAEVERAKGAAEAIEIENGKLTENYIRYLWVRQQDNLNDKTVIYIPTEAGLPILEADRLSK